MRVIMNVLAIERYVRVLSAWIFQRMQRVSPNKKQNDDVVKHKVINKRKYKGNEENVSGN